MLVVAMIHPSSYCYTCLHAISCHWFLVYDQRLRIVKNFSKRVNYGKPFFDVICFKIGSLYFFNMFIPVIKDSYWLGFIGELLF